MLGSSNKPGICKQDQLRRYLLSVKFAEKAPLCHLCCPRGAGKKGKLLEGGTKTKKIPQPVQLGGEKSKLQALTPVSPLQAHSILSQDRSLTTIMHLETIQKVF